MPFVLAYSFIVLGLVPDHAYESDFTVLLYHFPGDPALDNDPGPCSTTY